MDQHLGVVNGILFNYLIQIRIILCFRAETMTQKATEKLIILELTLLF